MKTSGRLSPHNPTLQVPTQSLKNFHSLPYSPSQLRQPPHRHHNHVLGQADRLPLPELAQRLPELDTLDEILHHRALSVHRGSTREASDPDRGGQSERETRAFETSDQPRSQAVSGCVQEDA